MKTKGLFVLIILSLGMLIWASPSLIFAQISAGDLFIGDTLGATHYTVPLGQVLTTAVQISNLPPNTAGVAFQLAFNPAVVQLVDAHGNPTAIVETTDIFGSGMVTGSIKIDNVNGIVDFNVRSLSSLNASGGAIAILRWKGQAMGTSPQTFSGMQWLEAGGQVIGTATAQNGDITITEQSIKLLLEPASLIINAVGDTAIQTIKTEGVAALGEIYFRLTFDESVVQVEKLELGTLYQLGNVKIVGNSIEFAYNGTYRASDGDMLKITWRAVGVGGPKDLAFSDSDLVLKDDFGQIISHVTAERGSVTISKNSTPTSTPTATATPLPTMTATPSATMTPSPTSTSLRRPSLQVTPDKLNFTVAVGDSDPVPQGIIISNEGNKLLNWQATSSHNWLSLTSYQGTVEATSSLVVYVRANPTDLSVGTYKGNITIKGDGNLQKVIAVTLEVQAAFVVQPNSFTFEAIEGGVDPAAQLISLIRTTAEALDWTASANQTWLSVDPNSGTATANVPSQLNVRVNVINLKVGTYNGQVTISNGNGNDPLTVNVTLTVYSANRPTVTPLNISGRVTLQQGQNLDYSGVKVYLSNQSCALFNARGTTEPEKAVTDTNGNFTVPTNGQYQCLQVVKIGYLRAARTSPVGNTGTIKLLAGDVVPNDAVDIFDLSYIGSRYGLKNVQANVADLDHDGDIDIFDLSLAAGNYHKQGPLTDWQ